MKNYFFATSVVLVFVSLSGCDDPGDQVVSGDAGVVAKVSDAGVVAKVSDTGTAVSDPLGSPHCKVPTPEYLPAGTTTVPRGGYLWVLKVSPGDPAVLCASDKPGSPSNCLNPDGYWDGGRGDWCCVLTYPSSDVQDPYTGYTGPDFVYAQDLYCGYEPGGAGLNGAQVAAAAGVPGDVALCTTDGTFVGWKCPFNYGPL